jgi:EAL domain-containing protein (putative c-di-GMP-specific phosphodiesterase class I)
VIAVPFDAASDNEGFGSFRRQVLECGLGIAYDRFPGGQLPAREGEQAGPELLKLAPSVVRDIHRTPHSRQQMEAAMPQARAAGFQVVATAVRNEEEAACCRRLGCELGQGKLYGEPEPVWSLTE